MADCATLQTRLAEAEEAYHRLMTGSQEEVIRYGEKQITYTPASTASLATYIATLRQQVAACTGTEVAGRRRVIHPYLGD